ncbi:MAG: ABC transporter permease, partial [Chloroflexota bacterium]|nr:ABC transporter permease [Chloroflexota bacterium]
MKRIGYLLRRNPIGVFGGAIVLIFIVIAIIPGWFAAHDPIEMSGPALSPPDNQFPLGTDRYGRDIWSRIAYGTSVSFQVGFLSVIVAAIFGVILGMSAGFFRGTGDYLIMRVMDTIFAFPSILLAIAIVAVIGSGLVSIVFAIVIVYTPIFARVARASTLSIKEQEFVLAAHATGVGKARILYTHIFPNITSPILVQMALSLSGAI